ncbi:MAG: exodeoxyribonuclease VII small subunit [Desulfuromonadaceae bacterium GWC2_58_13]|nr:MAG: exodeoxyribonuclease VII small subunit [Desulfuromonadaceae bacterium GWC2_58_13]
MPKKETFETALKALEAAVDSLENEDLGLEASLSRFEGGVKSAALCQKLLKDVETRVEQLMRTKDGDFTVTKFEEP